MVTRLWDIIGGVTGRALRYNSSWDWLVPVVDKIKSIETYNFDFEFTIGMSNISDNTVVRVRESNKGMIRPSHYRIIICEETRGIETAYKAVVEFLKWYKERRTDDTGAD